MRTSGFRRWAIAIAFVFVMVLSSFAVIPQGADAGDAQPGYESKPVFADYGYKLEYNSTNTQVVDVKVSVAGSDFESKMWTMTAAGYTFNTFWRFNEDGMGPFNCFYAALNLYNGHIDDGCDEPRLSDVAGNLAYVLSPNNMSKTLAGNSFDTRMYNIVLVIPTVYWYSDPSTGTLYLSNNPEYSKFPASVYPHMKAYAHTMTDGDGFEHVRSYLGIGVYPSYIASADELNMPGGIVTVDDTSKHQFAVSQPDREATGGYKVDKFTEFGRNDSLLANGGMCISEVQSWNYYQWTLYKMMSYTIMGTKNVQLMMGPGQQNPYTTLDYTSKATSMPFAGGTGTVAMLIQNAWGSSLWQGIGDAYAEDGVLYVGNSSTWTTLGKEGRTAIEGIGTPSGTIGATSTDSATWDMPIAAGGGNTILDIGDDVNWNMNKNAVYVAGGKFNALGLANVVVDTGYTLGYSYHKMRMAVIFDYGTTTLTFDNVLPYPNHETYTKQVSIGDMLQLAPNEFVNPDPTITFKGWSYTMIGTMTDVVVPDRAYASFVMPTTLHAVWDGYFVLHYETNGGSPMQDQMVQTSGLTPHGVPVDPRSDPSKLTTREGYALVGWYTDPELTDEVVFGEFTIYSSTTIYAKWEASACKVTFDTAGGTRLNPVYIAEGSSFMDQFGTQAVIDQVALPTRSSFDFAGWYTDPGLTDPFTYTDPVETDMTIFADWTPTVAGPVWTVTFNSNGGSPVANQSVLDGHIVNSPYRPTRDGYSFGEWYSDPSLTRQYSFDTPVTSSFTLYAKWDEAAYAIIFDPNGAEGDRQWDSVGLTARYTLPDDIFQMKGYEISGWSTAPSGGTVYSGTVSGLCHSENESIVLYAVWSPLTSQDVDEGDDIIWILQRMRSQALAEEVADNSKETVGMAAVCSAIAVVAVSLVMLVRKF